MNNPTHCPECSTELRKVNHLKRPGYEVHSRLLECVNCLWFEQRRPEKKGKKSV